MRRRAYTMSAIALLTLLSVFGAACGGGGGGGGGGTPPPGGLSAAFAPAIANPGANTVSMGAATANMDMVTIPILVTDLNDFFGAAFTINFDSTRFSFVGFDGSNTFIEEAGVTTDVDVQAVSAGQLAAFATRFNGAGGTYEGGMDAVGSEELLTITLRATQAVSNSPITITNNNVETCNDGTQTCGTFAGVTWGAGSLSAN